MAVVEELISAAKLLSNACDKAIRKIERKTIVAHATNPLDYAWQHHEQYLINWGSLGAKILLLGMNPGRGVWHKVGCHLAQLILKTLLRIKPFQLETPGNAHPKRPIVGLDLERQKSPDNGCGH